MYYLLISVSVLMFGVQFLFSERYQKESGNGVVATMMLTFLSSVTGVICLGIINGFSLSLTPFTLLMAVVNALNSLLFTVCSLKSLEKINLSLYSLFSMLGGMMLPFLMGLLFYDEKMTVGKAICVVLVTVALALTVNKGNKKVGVIYYCGIFVLNGMAGVISKLYESAPYEKVNAAGYSMWSALVSVVIGGVALLILHRSVKRPTLKAVAFAAGSGVLSRIANFFLLLSLAVLPATVQYPFITGGVMIVSTVIAVITGQKPSKKEIASVALSFVGLLCLVLL